MIGDQTLASPGLFGQAAYTLTASTNQVKRYPALARLLLRRETVADPALSSYLVCESHYNRYVYDQFLEVPADTAALLRSVPVLGLKEGQELESIPGASPNPAQLGEGCEFAERCAYCTERCRRGRIPAFEIEPGHRVRCLRFDAFREVD